MVTFTGDVRALFTHSSHQHGLKLVATDKLFQCDGCRQLGDELRYRCEQCDFDLHACCAQAPASMEHSMFEGRVLTLFASRPATPIANAGVIPNCDVCADPVQGLLYHNREHDHDLHPVCAFLPKRTTMGEDDDGPVQLELHKATGHDCGLCGEAGYRSRFLAYRFLDDDREHVYLHVACLMEAKYSGDDDASSTTTAGEVSDRRLVNAPSTTTGSELAMVEYAPRRRKRDKLKRFCKIAYRVAKVSYSVATLNPVGVVTAIVKPL